MMKKSSGALKRVEEYQSYADKTKKRHKSSSKPSSSHRSSSQYETPVSTDPDFSNVNFVALGRYKRNHDMMSEILGFAPLAPLKKEKRFIKYTQATLIVSKQRSRPLKPSTRKEWHPPTPTMLIPKPHCNHNIPELASSNVYNKKKPNTKSIR
ncbi:hypothetical protein BC829DRAFT_429114, partial [Chytridium lagenaria]